VGVEVADHPAAAVEEDEQAAARRTGDVEAGAELAVRAADGEFGHALDLARAAGDEPGAVEQIGPGRGDRLRSATAAGHQRLEPEQQLQIGVENVAVDLDRRAGQAVPHRRGQRHNRRQRMALDRLLDRGQSGPQQPVHSWVHKE
jgi:hypothetical protein